MRDLLAAQQALCGGEVRKDVLRHLMPLATTQVSKAVKVDTGLVDRCDRGEPFCNAELMVVAPASRRNVHDAGPLFRANLIPSDHAMRRSVWAERLAHRWECIKWRAVLPTDQFGPLPRLKHLRARSTAAECCGATRGANPELAAVKLHQLVVERGLDCGGNIRHNGPRRRGPCNELLARPIHKC